VQVFFFIASFSFQGEQYSWLPFTLTKLPVPLKQKLAAQQPDDFSPAFQGRGYLKSINARRGQRRLKSSVAAAMHNLLLIQCRP
jgi:hypothetical protein